MKHLTAICAFALVMCGCQSARMGRTVGVRGPERAVLPLYRNRLAEAKIFVEATLPDGRPHLFLLDTGSSVTVLSQKVADSLGLVATRRSGELVGLGGTAPWFSANLSVLKLGPFQIRDLPVAVGVVGVPDHIGIVPLAGIIGNDILGRFQTVVDYPANVLELARAGVLPVPDTAVALFFNGQHPLIRTTLTARSTSGVTVEQPALLEIDTGARGLLLFGGTHHGLDEVSTEGVEPIAGIGTGDHLVNSNLLRQTRRVPIVRFQAGGKVIETPQSATWIDYDLPTRRHTAGMPGLLGYRAIRNYRVMIDYPGKRFSLTEGTNRQPMNDVLDWHLKRHRKQHDPITRIKLLLMLNRVDEAERRLEQLVKSPTLHPDAVVLLSRARRADGDIQGAHTLLASITIGDLVENGEIVAWVNGLWLAGELEQALEQSELAIRLNPKSATAWLARADSLLAAGRTREARSAMGEVVMLRQNPDAHLLRRAFVSSEDGDTDGAMTHYRRLLRLHPGGGYAQWLYTTLAHDELRQKLVASDINHAQQRLHPGDEPLDFLAGAWRMLDQTERSQHLMERGLVRDCSAAPSETSEMNCRAWYNALANQDLPEARVMIEKALEAEPHRPEFMDTMAVVLEAQGELQAARDMAWRAAAHSPDDVYLFTQALRLDKRQAQ